MLFMNKMKNSKSCTNRLSFSDMLKITRHKINIQTVFNTTGSSPIQKTSVICKLSDLATAK